MLYDKFLALSLWGTETMGAAVAAAAITPLCTELSGDVRGCVTATSLSSAMEGCA